MAKTPMKLKDMLLTSNDYVGLKLGCVSAEKLPYKDRRELVALLKTSYADWGMEELFAACPSRRNLYVFRLFSGKRVVASRQVLLVRQNRLAPLWAQEIAHTLGINNYAVGSRAIVHPDYRDQGIGSRMVSSINERIFMDNQLDVMLGSSTSLGAIALYLRMGANIWRGDIDNLPFNNGVEQKHTIFAELLNHKEFRLTRFNQPIRYLYHKEAVSHAWYDYLWTNQKPCAAAMIANDKLVNTCTIQQNTHR